jgi:hypothetical protein
LDDAGMDPDASEPDGGDAGGDEVGPPPPSFALVALDQEVEEAGADTIVIESVTSSEPTWLVIDGSDGSTGRETLAAVALPEGTRDERLEVTLSRDVTYDERLFVALHEDRGAPGVYEPGVDVPVDGAAGDAQGNDFRVTIVYEPVIETTDQIASITRTPPYQATVMVPRVVSPRGGYVVVTTRVYDDLGHAVVPPGESLFVTVPLSRAPNRLEELVVTLAYEDDPTGGMVFDGFINDPPVRDETGDLIESRFIADVPAVELATRTRVPTLDAFPAERVKAPPGCLLVLHEELPDGSAGRALGATGVSQGETLDVEIPTTLAGRPLLRDERVVARLYFDDPVGIGTYEGTEVALRDLSGGYIEDASRVRVSLSEPGIVSSFYSPDHPFIDSGTVDIGQLIWKGEPDTIVYLFEFDPNAYPAQRDDLGPLNLGIGGSVDFIRTSSVNVYRPVSPGTRIWVAAYDNTYQPPGTWTLAGRMRTRPDGTPWMTSFEILPAAP